MKELTKYEYARIIGARALQLSLGAPPMVKVDNKSLDFLLISVREFEEDALPLSLLKV